MVSSVTGSLGKYLAFVTRGQAPEPCPHVVELLASLKMTPRDLNNLYKKFYELQQFQSRTVNPGPGEISEDSMLTLIAVRRYWVKVLLANLVELGGCRDVIPWDSFLYIFLRFCSLSKLELCQCLFFIITKSVKSWTVHYLTSTQLQEFYDFYANCPVSSFSTKSISFSRLPLNRYYLADFVELVHRFGQLVNPLVHLQRSMQQSLPSIGFWDDYDRFEVTNRKITLSFFLMTKKKSFMDLVERGDITQQEAILREEEERKRRLNQPVATNMAPPGLMSALTDNDPLAAYTMQTMQTMQTMPGSPTMNDSTLRTTASSPAGTFGAGVGMPMTSTSQPNLSMSQPNLSMSDMMMSRYGPSSSSQSMPLLMPKRSLPNMVLGALKSTFGVQQRLSEEDEYYGPYDRHKRRPMSPGAASRLKHRRRDFPAWIKQYMDLPKRTRLTTRFEEVDFIRKSRMRGQHRDNIVSIIERSCPCELLDRPGQGRSKARGKRTLDGDLPPKPGLGPGGKPGALGQPGAVPGAAGGPQAPGAQPQPPGAQPQGQPR